LVKNPRGRPKSIYIEDKIIWKQTIIRRIEKYFYAKNKRAKFSLIRNLGEVGRKSNFMLSISKKEHQHFKFCFNVCYTVEVNKLKVFKENNDLELG
jgi:hypothetical protein